MLVDSKQGQKLTGFFKGKVIKHLSFGRCKVWIPGVYPDEWSDFANADKLPTAEQVTPLFGGSNSGNGVFSYPNLGSVVICGFYNEDQNMPFFFGSILGGKDDALKNYNSVEPFNCSKNEDDQKKANIHKIKAGNSIVDIYENGKVEIRTTGDASGSTCIVEINGRSGNIVIKSSSKIEFNAPEISLTAKDKITLDSYEIGIKAVENLAESGRLITEYAGSGITQKSQSIKLEASRLGSFNKQTF